MTSNWLSIIFLLTLTCLGAGYTHADIIDPTKPPNLPNTHDNTLLLTAIFYAPNHSMAVINGKILHVGDQVNGVKIIDIKESDVDIDGPNGKTSLALTDFAAAKPVKNTK